MVNIHVTASDSVTGKPTGLQSRAPGAPGAMYAEIEHGNNGVNYYLAIDAIGPFDTPEEAYEAFKALAAALAPDAE
jgi:hypothetical protein